MRARSILWMRALRLNEGLEQNVDEGAEIK